MGAICFCSLTALVSLFPSALKTVFAADRHVLLTHGSFFLHWVFPLLAVAYITNWLVYTKILSIKDYNLTRYFPVIGLFPVLAVMFSCLYGYEPFYWQYFLAAAFTSASVWLALSSKEPEPVPREAEADIAPMIEKIFSEQGYEVDGKPALYALFKDVLKDADIDQGLRKISGGAGVNLKLKAYHMLWKEGRSPEKVVEYLKGRIEECLEREKRLQGSPSIGCEVEIEGVVLDYPKKATKLLAKLLNINIDEKHGQMIIIMEFSPQPARDWKDVAEMIDTMIDLGMIPVQEGTVFSLHINVARPEKFRSEKDEEMFEEGVNLITLAEGFLTSSDERLKVKKRKFAYRTEKEGHPEDVVKGQKEAFGKITEYGIGNVLADRTSHRRACRMVHLLHTALLAYLKTGRKSVKERLLSDIYKQFYDEFTAFLIRNKDKGLDVFLKNRC